MNSTEHIRTAEARGAYKDLNVDDVAQAYSSSFHDATLKSLLLRSSDDIDRYIGYTPNLSRATAFGKDIAALHYIIASLNPERIMNWDPAVTKKFRAIGKILLESGDITGDLNAIPSEFQTVSFLKLGVIAAFTPLEERESMQRTYPPFLQYEFDRIVSSTPDLTHLDTPRSRLEGIIDMLTLTHDRSLITVCQEQGIAVEDLATIKEVDTDKWRAIHKKAGEYYAANSFFNVLSDRGQSGDIFKVHPERGEKRTDTGHCPAKRLFQFGYRV